MQRVHGTNLHIIGEAGTNHGGDYNTALRLLDIGVTAGVDSVKYQIIYPEGLYLPRLFTAEGYTANEVFEKRAAAMLPDDEYRKLAQAGAQKGTAVTASIFDERGLDLLDSLDPPYFKIASCDLNNYGFLRAVAERKRAVVLSTGMASLGEIERAVSEFVKAGNEKLVLLHCVSVYPAPIERMNLSFMSALAAAFGYPVGLSDHTESVAAAAAAVALGATWIEKHYTFDRSARGFDHHYAMEPAQLASYVLQLRGVHRAMQRVGSKLSDDERSVRARARRGLYASRDLAAGEALREEDVLVVRPESSLSPGDLSLVVGQKLSRPVRQYEALTLSQLDLEEG